MMTAQKGSTAADVSKWFTQEMMPKRTAAAGFSGNRLWKGPISFVRGNVSDPNGLCGDAAAFVCEEFERKFGAVTHDGMRMGLVLWQGKIMNHIANVLISGRMTTADAFTYDQRTKTVVSGRTKTKLSPAELMRLQVFDLYYKQTWALRGWWSEQDSLNGLLKVGPFDAFQPDS